MGSQARRGTRIGRVDDFTEVGRLRDNLMEGDSHMDERDLWRNGVCTASEVNVLMTDYDIHLDRDIRIVKDFQWRYECMFYVLYEY